MSKTASFEYKCRMCGKIELNPHTSENRGLLALIEALHPTVGRRRGGQEPELIDIHACGNGEYGISDLQGFRLTGE